VECIRRISKTYESTTMFRLQESDKVLIARAGRQAPLYGRVAVFRVASAVQIEDSSCSSLLLVATNE
jgi:hypothetical protein